MKLPRSFYLEDDVVKIAKELLGKSLFTNYDGKVTGGIITETEAYNGIYDKACHAYNNRLTQRTEVMFRIGGTAYIYLCYGIYSLFNIVTNKKNVPQAVLIRGLLPTNGIEIMLSRINRKTNSGNISNGPGKLSKVLGIHYKHTGTDLLGETIWLEDNGIKVSDKDVSVSERIGVDYAKEDAKLPYRFKLNYPAK